MFNTKAQIYLLFSDYQNSSIMICSMIIWKYNS